MTAAAAPLIRHLGATDVDAFRALRLEALQREPLAFRATYADEADQPPDYFRSRLTNGVVFGAVVDGALVGTAGIDPMPQADASSCGVLWGVYLREELRGRGIARVMVEAVLDVARGRHAEIRLRVKATNAPARALYRRLGFLPARAERTAAADGQVYEYEWWHRPLRRR